MGSNSYTTVRALAQPGGLLRGGSELKLKYYTLRAKRPASRRLVVFTARPRAVRSPLGEPDTAFSRLSPGRASGVKHSRRVQLTYDSAQACVYVGGVEDT